MMVFSSNHTTIFSHFGQATQPGPSDQKLTPKNDGFCLCRTNKNAILKNGDENRQIIVVKRPKKQPISMPRGRPFPSVQFRTSVILVRSLFTTIVHFSILFRTQSEGGIYIRGVLRWWEAFFCKRLRFSHAQKIFSAKNEGCFCASSGL